MSIMAKILLSILLLIVMCALTAFFTWPDKYATRAEIEASFAHKVSLVALGLGILEGLLLFGWAFYGIWTS